MTTNSRFLLILMCLVWHTNSALLFSQSTDYFDGKVINSITFEPIPFATIWLKNSQLGVFANAEGDFKIIRNPEFQEDSLIITCIGYKQYTLSFKDLSDKEVNRIYLAPAIYEIGEVKVIAYRKNLSSVTIIRRAIRNIRKNYPNKPYNFISYYRDYQKRKGNYINLNEAIVQTLDNGFTSKSASNKYRLLDFRKNMDFPRMSISPYYDTIVSPDYNNPNKIIPNAKLGDQYGNELFILMVHDAIRNYQTRSFSFINTFSKDFLMNHDFSEPTPVYNNNLLLFKIYFSAKSRITGDSLIVSGAIYIQPKDYSIHKLEYSCSYLVKGRGEKEMYNIDTEYGYNNSIDSLMCLKYISFNNIFNVVDTTDNTYFRIINSYWDLFGYPILTFDFNNKIDPESAGKKGNYIIMFGDEIARVKNIEVKGKRLHIRLKDDKFLGFKDQCRVSFRNLKDINGNILNKRRLLEFYQYRELFVQEYNKPLSFIDSCYLQYLPLEQNCISKYTGNNKYWMNTPENIKIDK